MLDLIVVFDFVILSVGVYDADLRSSHQLMEVMDLTFCKYSRIGIWTRTVRLISGASVAAE
jgi:hypothetical protein